MPEEEKWWDFGGFIVFARLCGIHLPDQMAAKTVLFAPIKLDHQTLRGSGSVGLSPWFVGDVSFSLELAEGERYSSPHKKRLVGDTCPHLREDKKDVQGAPQVRRRR